MKTKTLLFLFIFISSGLFAQQRGLKPVSIKIKGKQVKLYEQSHALLIGNSNYTNGWNNLPGVREDIKEVKEALEKNDFNVIVKQNLTKTQTDKAFSDFIKKYGDNENNRLLFYCAGHGYTVKSKYGGEVGYLVSIDAPNPNKDKAEFQAKSIEMSQIEIYAERIDSKHAIFFFDACFAGSIFAMRDPVPAIISYKTKKPVRQFITSGSANETVPDKSIFREQFVIALTSNNADANKDGYMTGTELGKFLQDNVVNYSYENQHPQYGKIRNKFLDKGDFVFLINKKNTDYTNEEPKTGGLKKGKTVYKYGDISINTEIGGKIYLDDKYMGTIEENTSDNILEKQLTGSHTYKIVGTDETKTGNITVYENQTAYIEIKSKNDDFTVTEAGLNIKMRRIKGGTFTMGSNDSNADSDETPHTVTVSNFAIMKYEVTIEQYMKFVNATNSNYPEWLESGSQYNIKTGTDDYYKKHVDDYSKPIVGVSWHNAVAYAKWLSKKTGKNWRLPTEAEWEYAAKGGENYKYAGSDNIESIAWYSGNSDSGTHPVGQKSPNGYGLYDMTGNVREWCQDVYTSDFYSESKNATNPIYEESGSNRVIRGGSWDGHSEYCRSANRSNRTPSNSDDNIGFRLAETN